MDATGLSSGLLKDSALRAKFNFEFFVVSKESNRVRSLLCIIVQFGSDNQLPSEVARFLVFSIKCREYWE